MISFPGGDRGPAIGYKNHLKALNNSNLFHVDEINQYIWENNFDDYDYYWSYTRFNNVIYDRIKKNNKKIIGGPNIALERADFGISDDWEYWYLNNSKVDINLNVADYYLDHVKSFSTNEMKFKTLEYCYELEKVDFLNKKNDVLIYVKDRINENKEFSSIRVNKLKELFEKNNISYKILQYGTYEREAFLEDCKNSKIVTWLSIEDYCSLAQIEAQLMGCCVIGTPYNLTIPTDNDCIVQNVQTISRFEWVNWLKNKEEQEKISEEFFKTINKKLFSENLSLEVYNTTSIKHSYKKYVQNVLEVLKEI